MTQTGRPIGAAAPAVVAALFQDRLEEEVVLAASPDPDDRDLPSAARNARVRELLATLCPKPPVPGDREVDSYLARHLPPVTGERLLLRQLILPDEAAARQVRERIRRGEDFVALSRELSRASNAADGGLIGWVEKGQLPPEFEAVVFGLAPGQTSEPVASNAGWHVFQVVQRSTAGTPDPAARQRVRAELAARAAESVRRACLQQLAAKVGVEIFCEAAPFPCHNPFEEKQ
ncbi:MAG: peptidylprolyl isomerase [Acidobacteriota bacterium]